MTTPTIKEKRGFHIGVTCPGCGGNLELQEDFFVLTCRFCGSVLRIAMPEIPAAYLIRGELPKREIRFHIDRYLKKKGQPLTGSNIEIKSIYFPYWKINAVMLKVRNKKVEMFSGQTDDQGNDYSYEKEMTDIRLTPYTCTITANGYYESLPHSIGMRTEYVRLIPFSSENIDDEFTCIPATKNWSQITAELYKNVRHMGTLELADFGKNLTELFHPKGAVVYFPYYIVDSDYRDKTRQFLVDGVSGHIIKYEEHQFFEEISPPDDYMPMIFGKLTVDFHRCTNCGIDLPDRQSAVYICQNCLKLVLSEPLPCPIENIEIPESIPKNSDRMFPFWSFKIPEKDRAHISTMFGGIYKSDYLVIPGFKMANFEAMFRLAKRFSSAIKTLDLVPAEGRLDERFEPVTLGFSEALTLADVIIYREKVGKDPGRRAACTEFKPDEIGILYAPFHPENYFYVDSIHGAITFEKNSVR